MNQKQIISKNFDFNFLSIFIFQTMNNEQLK